MSEFSESYHLRYASQDAAEAIIRSAGLKGYVFPPSGDWTSFVVSDGSFVTDENIVEQNKGTLLHYVSAEDHGWSFALFQGDKKIISYSCEWDDEVRFDDSNCSEEAFRKLISDYGSASAEDVWPHLHPETIEDTLDVEASKLFAQAVGLQHYEWLAFDYVAKDFHKSPDDFKGVKEIK